MHILQVDDDWHTYHTEKSHHLSVDLFTLLLATVVSQALANNVPNASRCYGKWEEDKYLTGAYESGYESKLINSAVVAGHSL